MTSNRESSATGYSARVNEDQNAGFVNAQNQMLLKALQDFIIPLIRTVGQKTHNDTNQIPSGPEAGQLVVALQEFISNIVAHSQSRANNSILVEVPGLVVEENSELQASYDDEEEDQDSSSEVGSQSELFFKLQLVEDAIDDNNSENQGRTEYQESLHDGDEDADSSSKVHSLAEHSSSESVVGNNSSDNQEPTFHEKLVSALRKHVFKAMPIRLLCFEPYGSSFQITLVERGLVYQRLESMLRANIHQEDHLPKPENYDQPFKSPYPKPAETEQRAIDRLVSKYTQYAILSHTWFRPSGEVTYSDWNKGLFEAKDPGYQKLVIFAQSPGRTTDSDLAGWIPSALIKKAAPELDESIRSMYNWYSRAAVCITYLAETESISNMHIDPWFTRGWTLQELLAPSFIKFYDRDWKRLIANASNDKNRTNIMEQIKRATTISKDELHRIHGTAISRRMQLAASREATREEDTAYSLMGIFDVSISTAYGEGAERAFFRLLQEILASPGIVLDVINCAGEISYAGPHASRILPTSPQNYLKSHRYDLVQWPLGHPMEPLTLTHLGLRMEVILMPAMPITDKASRYVPIGDYSATVNISVPAGAQEILNASYNLLDNRIFDPDGHMRNRGCQLTLAVFNFFGNAACIFIRKTCMAKVLEIYEYPGKVTSATMFKTIDTDVPTVFELSGSNENHSYDLIHSINRDDLAKHGMQLVSLYL